MSDLSLPRQVIRYAVVGLLNNLLGYLIYLLMTSFGMDPKLAVTILYPITTTIGYFVHSKYSFAYRRGHGGAMLRYLMAHCIGYGVNVAMLLILYDHLKLPHHAVQAAAVFVVAGVLFLLFRYFVFPRKAA